MAGYFEIGICNGKAAVNVGTLWRSAYQLGASGIFTIGARYPKQASDTVKAWRHIPMRAFRTIGEFLAARPRDCLVVGVEMGGTPLWRFAHPERALYVLGAEDSGLSAEMLRACQRVVTIEAVRTESFNVAVAGSVVMWDRLVKG
jgi:tRNA G18 (ribose-2'-O)-methylase SpoU